MINTYVAFAELLAELMNRKRGHLGRVKEIPQKPSFANRHNSSEPMPRSTAEEEGVSSAWVCSLLRELYEQDSVHLHHLFIMRHGHVIAECAVDPYREDTWHASYSMCKSFISMAIGILADEGKLSVYNHVLFYFPEYANVLDILRFRDLTIRHLLTMSSGSTFNEMGAISGNDWVQGFFSSTLKFTPGSKFDYNSMNTFMLSAIITKITGKSAFEFLKERLFEPMGIRDIFWENSPSGITKAGWGLFIRPEDAAKLGQLYLNSGSWYGRQLISPEWIYASTEPQIETGKPDNPRYGYQIWMDHLPGSYMYNGMLGQNVHVYPSLDLVVVTNAGNEEVFAGGTMTGILRKWISPEYFSDSPLADDPESGRTLSRLLEEIRGSGKQAVTGVSGGWRRGRNTQQHAFFRFLHEIDGAEYELKAKGIGLMPLIMQVIHNNYTRGLDKLRFELRGDTLVLLLTEGETVHELPVGFACGKDTKVIENGEEYLVGVKGKYAYNEDGKAVLSLQIAFTEEAAERRLKIIFLSVDKLELRFSETPGDRVIAGTLELITTGSGNANPMVSEIMEKLNPETLEGFLEIAVKPVSMAERIKS